MAVTYVRYSGTRQARNSHSNSWGNVSSGPLLSILPGGPTAAQIGAGTLTSTSGTAVTWTRTTPGYVDTGAAQDPAQLLTDPEHLGNGSSWNNSGALITVTEAYATDPGGFQTGTRLQMPSAAGRTTVLLSQNHPQVMSPTGSWSNQTVTLSAYVKATNGVSATFALQATWGGVADYYSSNFTATGTWQRFTFTQVLPTNASTGDLYLRFPLPSTLAATDIVVSGVKMEIASSATPYNFTGQNNQAIRSLAANKPRVGPLGVLVESAATNLCLQSQAIGTAPWSSFSSGATAPVVTNNTAIAPDGTLTATTIALPAVTATQASVRFQPITVTASTMYTWSFYARGDGTQTAYAHVDVGGSWGSGSAKTTLNLTSSWQRFSITFTPISSGNIDPGIGCDTRASSANESPISAQNVYIWGAQIEAAAYPSSYIATTTTATARGRDKGTIAVAGGTVTDMAFAVTFTPGFGRAWNDSTVGGNYMLGLNQRGNPNALWGYGMGDHQMYCIPYDSGGTVTFNTAPNFPFTAGSTHRIRWALQGTTPSLDQDAVAQVLTPGTATVWTAAPTSFILGDSANTTFESYYASNIQVGTKATVTP